MVASNGRKQPKTTGADPDDDAGILVIGEDTEDPIYKTLFKLDGTPYQVLDNPPASLMLKYFDQQRKLGPNLAFSWLLEEMIGADGYRALLDSPKVTAGDFRRICELVLGIVLGNPERVPKSQTSGSRRTGG